MTDEPLQLGRDMGTAYGRVLRFTPPELKTAILILKSIFEEALRLLVVPLEVILHRQFGVRFLGIFSTVQLVSTAYLSVMMMGGYTRAWPVIAFNVLAAAMGVWHFIENRRHENSGLPWRYSYDRGEPHPFLWRWVGGALHALGLLASPRLSSDAVFRFGEPVLCLVVGCALYPLSPILTGLIGGGGFALGMIAYVEYIRGVNLTRDQCDARLIGECMSGSNPSSRGYDAVFVARVAVVRPQLSTPLVTAAGEQSSPVAEEPGEVPRVRIGCANCGRLLTAKAKPVARSAVCPYCHTRQRIPAVDAGHTA